MSTLGTDQLEKFREDYGLWRYAQHCKSDPLVTVDSCSACGAGVDDCVGRPSFRGKTGAELRAIVDGGCNGWAEGLEAMRWPTSLIVGGLQVIYNEMMDFVLEMMDLY